MLPVACRFRRKIYLLQLTVDPFLCSRVLSDKFENLTMAELKVAMKKQIAGEPVFEESPGGHLPRLR